MKRGQSSLLLRFAYVCMSVLSFASIAASSDLVETREAWLDSSEPGILIDDWFYEQKFDALSSAARLDWQPWTGYYWPDMLGGLSYRWAERSTNIPVRPSLSWLKNQSEEILNQLSPAEKYDIFLGRYDYPLTTYERRRTKQSSPSWWGLCHGWAPASIAFQEPQKTQFTNPDGVPISFYASDIKALLSFAQQYQRDSGSVRMLALRCNETLARSRVTHSSGFSVACRDVNPGSFHLVLAHWLSKKSEPLIMDIYQGDQVWNVPIVGYDSKIIDKTTDIYEGAARGTKEIVTVETKVAYIAQIEPHRHAVNGSNVGQLRNATYKYLLELDKRGIIRGGEWVTRGTPDFLWFQTPFQFSGFFQKLESIYNESIRSH